MNSYLLKQVRKSLRFTQAEFAEDVLGISRATYIKWESGKEPPHEGAEARITEFLKRYGKDLSEGDGSKNSSALLGASTAATLLGFVLLGPIGAITLGTVSALKNKANSKALKSIACPWCKEKVSVSMDGDAAEYLCRNCWKEFLFTPKTARAIRLS